MHALVIAAFASLALALPAQNQHEITMAARAPAKPTTTQCSTATKAPSKKLQCGPEGTLQHPAVLSTTNHVKSMNACVSSCLSNSMCKALAYDSVHKTCHLWSETAEQMGFQIGEPGLHIYDTKCFTVTCPTTTTSSACAATTSANLVPNGGFESGFFSPGFDLDYESDDVTAHVVSGGAYGTSQYSMMGNLTTTESAPAIIHLSNDFPICPSGSYTFSIDYQFARYNPNVNVNVLLYDSPGSQMIPTAQLGNLQNNDQSGIGQWHTYTSTFQWDTTSAAAMSLSIQNGQPQGGLDVVYLDNIIIKAQ